MVQKMNKSKFQDIQLGFIYGLCLGGIVLGTANLISSSNKILISSQIAQDFNMDGINDLIITNQGRYQTPMFGYQDPKTQEPIYVTGNRMKELFPKSKVDYKGIEARLNTK